MRLIIWLIFFEVITYQLEEELGRGKKVYVRSLPCKSKKDLLSFPGEEIVGKMNINGLLSQAVEWGVRRGGCIMINGGVASRRCLSLES